MASQICPDLIALQRFLKRQERAEQAATSGNESGAGESLQLQVGNTCVPAEREGYVNWTLFVHGDGSFDVSDRIKRVTVTLHPSFKNNVVVLNNAPFQLTRCGWGTFEVGVAVELYTQPSSGAHSARETTTVSLTHELSFDTETGASRTVDVPMPRAVAAKPAAAAAAAPAKVLASGAKGTLFDDLVVDSGLTASTVERSAKAKSAIARAMHGTRGNPDWASPVKVVHCDLEARPGYATRKAHEYNDTPTVLRAKVALLADMVRASKKMAAYTGAGISTASGIGDYASKAKDTTCGKNKKVRSIDAAPTLAHRVLAAMHTAGYLKHWVQQNHDGLPQKAGYPQECLNEIHGAWQDPSNPVVPMDGHLRRDLIDQLEEWSERADLCLVLGTSMCGMAADDFALSVNRRAHRANNKLGGMVVVSLQQTQHDDKSALRIFSKIDEVMALLVDELEKGAAAKEDVAGGAAAGAQECRTALKVGPYIPAKPLKGAYESVFHVPYKSNGDPKLRFGSQQPQMMVLDLRPGSAVRVTRGVGKGFVGKVRNMTATGDYVLSLPLQRENHPQRGVKQSAYTLGRWWVESAVKGTALYLPVVNDQPKFVRRAAGGGGGGGGGGSRAESDEAGAGAGPS